jgi:gentisate 1,2-dioxygenase
MCNDGQRLDRQRGDFFVVPPWAWHEYANDGHEETILFSVQDTPVMKALGLYREEASRQNGGHPAVTGTSRN